MTGDPKDPRTRLGRAARKMRSGQPKGAQTQLNKLLGTNVLPRFEEPRAGDVRDSLADITNARKFLRYEPIVSFEDGLRRSIDFYKSLFVSK